MRKVYICAPLGGNIEENLNKLSNSKICTVMQDGACRAAFLCSLP